MLFMEGIVVVVDYELWTIVVVVDSVVVVVDSVVDCVIWLWWIVLW